MRLEKLGWEFYCETPGCEFGAEGAPLVITRGDLFDMNAKTVVRTVSEADHVLQEFFGWYRRGPNHWCPKHADPHRRDVYSGA